MRMSFKGVIGEVVETERSIGVFSIVWWIADFLSLACEGGDRYESTDFDACDGRWRFRIYPKGLSRDPPSNYVSLYLIRLDKGPPQTLDVTLGIRGAEGVENKRKRIQEFSIYDNICFWCKFCSRLELGEQESRLMPPGNVLTVSLDMKTNHVPIVARGGNLNLHQFSFEEMQKSLHGLLAGGEDSDVLIRVRGKEFPAHRAILRARSAVFQAMFAHDMVERQSGVVTMEDCDPESFPDFLEHVYTGSTQMISTGNVFSLYAAADKYDLNALKKACMEFVKNNLSVSCFCDAITLAVKHDEKELIECATEFFCSNVLEVLKTVEWEIFLKENTTIGNELLLKAFSKYV